MLAPRALVLRGPGTNCDHETAHAFERAGGISRRVHVQALADKPALLDDFQIFCIPGGFSYGDDIASGRILALELSQRLGDTLRRFHERGGLILGICNGFQVLLQTGLLLPAADAEGRRQATLAHNTSGRFIDCWVHLQTEPGRCVFLQGLSRFELPVAHAEGRFVTTSESALEAFDRAGLLVLRYSDNDAGHPTNPNGSAGDVAGMCDQSGRILGLMPHPERFIEATQHPAWMGRLDPTAEAAGLAVFRNAIRTAGGDAG
jgi:phosphoribosylformylglycinamidine synthase I